MTAEDIINTPGALRDAAWLRAIRALPDPDFERLVRMQWEEDRLHDAVEAAVTGCPSRLREVPF